MITKSPAQGFLTSINRSYSLATSGTSGWTATLRLHYRDDELKGMDEHDLQLWNRPGSSDPWVKIAASKSDYYYNWLEPGGGATIGDWALTAKPRLYLPFIKR